MARRICTETEAQAKAARIVSPRVMAEMHGWCADVFGDYPADATDVEVLRVVARAYDGGIAGFRADTVELDR